MKTCRKGLHQYEGKQCLDCQRLLRATDPGRVRATEARSRAKSKIKAGGTARYWFDKNLKRKKLSVEVFAWLLHGQAFKCANPGCGRAIDLDTRYGFALDHDHTCCSSIHEACGKCFRGILCVGCNTALGGLGENKERVLGLLSYLKSHVK